MGDGSLNEMTGRCWTVNMAMNWQWSGCELQGSLNVQGYTTGYNG